MQEEFNQKSFDAQSLDCPKCQWQGKGSDAIVIDLYGVSSVNEVHCPQCDEKLGNLKKEDDAPGESASDLSFQFG